MRYAQGTRVSSERSKAEIERLLTRYGTHPIYITDRKGGDPSEWPEDLRVREYPSTTKGVAS